MDSDRHDTSPLSARGMLLKTLLPVAIGIGVVAWLFAREFSIDTFLSIPFTAATAAALALALLFVAGREWGMMWRWRVLSDRRLSWHATFRVTMMCEFTSAVTPTTAGGSALSMIFLHREGIALGRGASLTMVTLMLDELFVVVTCPLLFLLLPADEIFGFAGGAFGDGLRMAFWIVYGGICAFTALLYAGAFVIPHRIAAIISRIFSWRPLRRWKEKADETGRSMTEAGADLRTRPLKWWLEAMGATTMTWVSRYLVVNALFLGFAPEASQSIVFARQFVVWTLLTVSPTPGGSGISEWLFTNYYGDLIGSLPMALVIAVIWRVVSYYIYLLAGIAVLPSWLRRRKR